MGQTTVTTVWRVPSEPQLPEPCNLITSQFERKSEEKISFPDNTLATHIAPAVEVHGLKCSGTIEKLSAVRICLYLCYS